MAFAENFSAFFQLNGFAISALYNGLPIIGILNNPDQEYALGGVGFEASEPRFYMELATLPGNYQYGDTLIANSTTYIVQAFQADGSGAVWLILKVQ
jgi:hypothetical protein